MGVQPAPDQRHATAMVLPCPQGLLTKVVLWLILATTLFGPSFEARPSPTIFQNLRTATSELELAPWPVVTDTTVFVCKGNLTYTPPSTAHFVELDCVDYGCNTGRRLNRETSATVFEQQNHGQSFVHQDGADIYSCDTTLTYTVDADSTEDVGLNCDGPYRNTRDAQPSTPSESECMCEISSSSSSSSSSISQSYLSLGSSNYLSSPSSSSSSTSSFSSSSSSSSSSLSSSSLSSSSSGSSSSGSSSSGSSSSGSGSSISALVSPSSSFSSSSSSS